MARSQPSPFGDGQAGARIVSILEETDFTGLARKPFVRGALKMMHGPAYLAGLATGVWKSREEISHLWSCNQLFEPKMDAAQREKLVKGWHKAVGRSQDWAEHEV